MCGRAVPAPRDWLHWAACWGNGLEKPEEQERSKDGWRRQSRTTSLGVLDSLL